MSPKIITAQAPEDIAIARELFAKYAAELSVNLRFQNFERELQELPGQYSPPGGRLLLGFVDANVASCGALRDLGSEICEMKRLYVLPEFRHAHAGRAMAEALIATAREIGYRAMRLDTLPEMVSAHKLYESLGFREIPAYRFNPVAGTRYMELDLGSARSENPRRAHVEK